MKPGFIVRSTLAMLLLVAGAAMAKDAMSPRHARGEKSEKSEKAEKPENAMQTLAIGAPAPMRGVKMKAVDGRDVSVASAAGPRGTLVVFTCNHCPWAKMWQSRVAAIGNAAIEQGIGVVAINSNDPAEYPEDDFASMQDRSKSLGLKFPYAMDATSDIARAFGASRTPEAFLFDAKGKLVYHGTIDDNARDESAVQTPWLHDAVNAIAAGKPVEVSETKSMGCGIKYREKKAS